MVFWESCKVNPSPAVAATELEQKQVLEYQGWLDKSLSLNGRAQTILTACTGENNGT